MELGPAGQFKIIFEKAGSAVAILKAINRDNCRLRPQIEKRFPGVTSHNQRLWRIAQDTLREIQIPHRRQIMGQI